MEAGRHEGYLIVPDIQAALDKLAAAGIEVNDYHVGAGGRVGGLDPEHGSYRSSASFNGPDGNVWVFQEVTTRLPGRVDPGATSFGSASALASAMRRCEGRPRRAREAHRRGRSELARLVRRVHGGGGGLDGAADVSDYDVIVIGDGTLGEHRAGASAKVA